MSKGSVIYRGPSMLDGREIVAIATYNSKNPKTGDVAQVWILRADRSPTESVHTGADASVCGNCPHRGSIVDGRNTGRSCYVKVFQAPRSVWEAYWRGNYTDSTDDVASALAGRFVRWGAYGDPAALPHAVLERGSSRADGWTGYTHQWRLGFAVSRWLMASCETMRDEIEANALGYRSFRMTPEPAPPLTRRHMVCPASEEGGHKLTCQECRACEGSHSGRRSNVQIAVHGASRKYALPVLNRAA